MYLSTAVVPFSDEDLEILLDTARKNNQKKEVTGLLILKGRSFLQCLEGKKEDVLEIFGKIEQDERHDSIIQLIEEDDVQRYFPDWSMGYKNFNHLDAVSSKRLKDFSQLENIETLCVDDIAQIFKEFIEVK
jgi:hypothetical protein